MTLRPPPRKIPPRGPDPEAALRHIDGISQNARANWFALLGLLAYVGVTMMAHKDADFFAYGVATQLPIINLSVPTVAFFIAAPLLMAAVYCYFQVYLVSLWDEVADAPPKFVDGILFDYVFPTFITQSAVLYRARVRADGSAVPRAFSGPMLVITVALVWWTTPLLLAYVFLRSTANHDTLLSAWIGLCLWAVLLFGHRGFRVARQRLDGHPRSIVHAPRRASSRRQAARVGVAILAIAWLFTSGFEPIVRWFADPNVGLNRILATAPSELDQALTRFATSLALEDWLPHNLGWHRDLSEPVSWAYRTPEDDNVVWAKGERPRYDRLAEWTRITLTPATFAEAPLTPRPSDWRSFANWMEDFEASYRQRKGLKPNAPLGAHEDDYKADAAERYADYIAALATPILQNRDVRNAKAERAFLPGADLRRAQMQGADLIVAQMQGADLIGAEMQGANLIGAQMQGTNLSGAEMQGANLSLAEMQGANLSLAEMQGADLIGAQMQGADLSSAKMQGANLFDAQMQGANLSRAQMQGANLSDAEMQGANLSDAQMQGAILLVAEMQGTNLSGAEMQGANLSVAKMQGADLSEAQAIMAECQAANLSAAWHSAILLCLNSPIEQSQLAYATGDRNTRLPLGLHVSTCLNEAPDTLPEPFKSAIALHGEGSIFRISSEEYHNLILCDPNAEDETKRTPHIIEGTMVRRGDHWVDLCSFDVVFRQSGDTWAITRARHTAGPPIPASLAAPEAAGTAPPR